jgi:RNA polymerase sigma factor (sigma-70 family)
MNASISIQMAEKSNNSVAKMIKKYSDQISGFINSKVSNNDDAKDILQDVWFQLSRLTNLDEIESMSGWLYRVARNRITDSYRKKKPDPLENYLVENGEGEFTFREILLADDSGNPELGMFKELFWNELSKALDELPPNQKEVFVLNEIEDMTLQDIADKTGANIKTIISRKGYAVKHLRIRLNHLYNELNN